MPATLYLRPSPRAFFLLTDTHALIFRQPDAAETKASRSVVVAEFLPLDEVDMRGLVKASKGSTVEGVLGVTSVPTERSPVPEIFLLLVSMSGAVAPLLPSSSLHPARVVAVEFHSLSSSFWDAPDIAAASVADYDPDDPYPPTYPAASSTQSQASQQGIENPCNGMRKYIESGGFFYAKDVNWDISTRMGETNWIQAEKEDDLLAHPLETFDERFVWNTTLLKPMLDFRRGLPEDQRRRLDEQSLIIPVIQGFCGSLPISTNQWGADGRPEIAALALISRLSWKRAGARFRTRGIDDDGQVANFVETELILATEGVTMSYAQVRGSVPLFWQQPQQGIQTLQQRVEITRPPQASQPAFDKHFIDLLEHYHSVHAVNLLGQKDAEAMLSTAYSDHLANLQRTLEKTPASEKAGLEAAPQGTLALTPYDFHASLKVGGYEGIKYDFQAKIGEVVRSMDKYGWTAVDTATGQIIEQQNGVFRVNCLDCLDRTNYVQDVISQITLGRFLESIGSALVTSPTLWAAHRELWADNGDRLSKIYAGTGALNTSATRTGKKTFAGMLSDATKSVGRAYINNFQDKGKQAAIDMLLGMMSGQRPVILFDPISDSVQSALTARINEFSRTKSVTLFTGTWNLNGKAPDEALDDWLWPEGSPEADIYAIAFQEIVELTAGQILQTDPAKRRMWEKYIMDTFAMRQMKSEYILYRSEQLVGTALIIVAKVEVSSHIRRVESATKKTGLQGLSGNKGGVGIRLDLYDSSICFMTCHLAAGHSNVNERNADYRTISTGMKFLRGRMIEDHDIVVWFADFNYRIALPNADVREYAENHKLDPLLAADQLLQAMDDGEVFQGYDEGPITFPPTYKYDNGTDTYDTSEKARIPAWTDRVLFKGSSLRLKDYNRADLRTSDHRPVYAVFDATIRVVDHIKRDAIAKELLHTIRLEAGDGKLDGKIERATNGGVSSLVKGLTHTSISSETARVSTSGSPRPSNGVPRIPPRPQASTDSYRSFPTNAPALPARPSSSNKKPESNSSFAIARKPAPPIPGRTPSTTSVSSLVQPSPGKRAPPPIPSNRGVSNQPPSPALSGSPILTPASTGDFVLITSPTSSRNGITNGSSKPAPPLPPRASTSDSRPIPTPLPRPSLDMSGPSPAGLVSPVLPDATAGQSNGSTNAVAAKATALAKAAPPPPSTFSKPKPAIPAKAVHPLLRKPDSSQMETTDDAVGPTSEPSHNKSISTSPLKKPGPPIVPKKPAALRRGSSAAHDQA